MKRLLVALVLLPVVSSAEPGGDASFAGSLSLAASPAAGRVKAGAIGRYSNCPGADPDDVFADDDALQECLDAGGTVALRAGEAGYLISRGLRVTREDTTFASQDPASKAVLKADPGLRAPILRGDGRASGLRLENIVLDGNKTRRTVDCRGYRDYGTNLTVTGAKGLVIRGVESVRAMCGSAMEIYASDYEIAGCVLKDNGFDRSGSTAPDPWSDGITAGICVNGWIHDNVVEDSTDIGIVSGGGKGCRVENNVVRQSRQHAFAGVAMHNFPDAGDGDQEGSVFRGNAIESAPGLLDFGLSIGIHPWFDAMTHGGTVVGNRVSGAVVSLAVDGWEGGEATGNDLGPSVPPFGQGLTVCKRPAAYTVAHATNVCLQAGYVPQRFHNGDCAAEPAPVDRCAPALPPAEPSDPTDPGRPPRGSEGAASAAGEPFPTRYFPPAK